MLKYAGEKGNGDSSYVGGTLTADRQEMLLTAFMTEYGTKN